MADGGCNSESGYGDLITKSSDFVEVSCEMCLHQKDQLDQVLLELKSLEVMVKTLQTVETNRDVDLYNLNHSGDLVRQSDRYTKEMHVNGNRVLSKKTNGDCRNVEELKCDIV
jgi:hypothetical protein